MGLMRAGGCHDFFTKIVLHAYHHIGLVLYKTNDALVGQHLGPNKNICRVNKESSNKATEIWLRYMMPYVLPYLKVICNDIQYMLVGSSGK